MRLTDGLKLKIPEDGDTYNSALITDNTNDMDRFMANIGGGSGVTTITNTTLFMTTTDQFTIEAGANNRLELLGNGYATIYLRFRNNFAIAVDAKGYTGADSSKIIIANMMPRYVPALTVPLCSGGTGPAVNGYIANSSNIVLRLFMGKLTSIPANTLMEFEGTYPLEVVPTSMGLTHMQESKFDWEVHGRNMEMIDLQAARLKMKAVNSTWAFVLTEGTTDVTSIAVNQHPNGRVTFNLVFKLIEPSNSSATGDIGNITLGYLNRNGAKYTPTSDVALFSTGTGPVAHGAIYTNGNVILGSMMGNSQALPGGQPFNLYGEFYV